MSYSVTVTRVNEGEHQNSEENYDDVTAVNVSDDGSVTVAREEGRQSNFAATTWGSVTITRVAGR